MKPLVTVAIPLYRSACFLPEIFENIDNLAWPNLEILVSDRHGLDDAIEKIADRYREDRRLKILKADDGLGWVDHYNLLAKTAKGEFFMWMPHDDSFPAGYLEKLSAAMIENPDVGIGYGSVRPVSLDGIDRKVARYSDAAGKKPSPPGFIRAIVFYMVHPWVPFRGLVRRSVVIEKKLFVDHCRDEFGTDANWVMSMLHVAPLLHVPDVFCFKRFYPESTHRQVVVNESVLRSSARSLARTLASLGYPALYARSIGFFVYVLRNVRRSGLFRVLPANVLHRAKRMLQQGTIDHRPP